MNSPFFLTPLAFEDMRRILANVQESGGFNAATRVHDQLQQAFCALPRARTWLVIFAMTSQTTECAR